MNERYREIDRWREIERERQKENIGEGEKGNTNEWSAKLNLEKKIYEENTTAAVCFGFALTTQTR